MKKSLLFFLLSVGVIGVQAQKNVLVSDSTFSSEDNDSYDLVSANQYYYNSQCQDSAMQSVEFDPFFGDSTGSQTTYDYYPDGSVYHVVNQVSNDEGILVNSTRITYTYTATKKAALVVNEQWDATSNTWVLDLEYIYVYNESGFLTSDTTKSLNANSGMLEVSSYTNYYSNGDSLSDSSVKVTPASNITTKSFFTYSSGHIQQVVVYNYTGTILINGNRITYTHDSADYVTTDNVKTEVLLSSGDYELYTTIITQNTYNADGTLSQTFVTSNFEFTPTVTVFYTKTNYHYAPCAPLILPVSLLSFSAMQKSHDALLQWKTGNEINTAYFTVQRSTDGLTFTNIGKILASGNTSVQKNYSFTDANINLLTTTKVYYRLAEKDNDGAIAYSKIAGLTISAGKLSVSVSPNPVQNAIILYSPVSLTNALVKVIDMHGVVVYTLRQNIATNSKVIIDASALAKGTYMVTVQSQTGQQVLKIIK